MSRTTSGDNFQVLVVAVICGIGYWLFPSGEDWLPLDLDSYEVSYFDRNSLSWSGNVVLLSIKVINKDGAPFVSAGWQVENKNPQGIKVDVSLDCQQRRMRPLNMFVFLREGQYAKVPTKEDAGGGDMVLDSANKTDQKLLALCDSERPGWHPFRYKWIRGFFPSMSTEKR